MANSTTTKSFNKLALGIVIGIAVTLILVELSLVIFLAKTTGLPVIRSAAAVHAPDVYPPYAFDPSDIPRLRTELAKAGVTDLKGEEQVLAILRWVMSLTTRVEDNRAQ